MAAVLHRELYFMARRENSGWHSYVKASQRSISMAGALDETGTAVATGTCAVCIGCATATAG